MNKKLFLLLTPVFSVSLTGCGFMYEEVSSNIESNQTSSEPTSDSSASENKKITLGTLVNFDIHTEIQTDYIENRFNVTDKYHIDGYHELSKPEALTLNWKTENITNVDKYIVKLSLTDDFEEYSTYEVTDKELEITNLFIHQDYYWNVTAVIGSEKVTSKTGHFRTSDDLPRNLDIDGVTNVRDIGGYPNGTNSYTKQGLLYRCGRLNKSNQDNVEYQITEKGIDVMRNELHIKSEIDLRKRLGMDSNEYGGITSSPLGEDINYYPCPMTWDGNILTENTQMVKNVIALLANPSNYPMIFHCNIGTDRTGLIAYLVNCLLGVSDYDLKLDYEYSNLGLIEGTRSFSNLNTNYPLTINNAQGMNRKEKCTNYLLGIGVEAYEISSIQNILS